MLMMSSTTEPFTDDEILAVFSERQVEQDNSDNDKDANDVIDGKKKLMNLSNILKKMNF